MTVLAFFFEYVNRNCQEINAVWISRDKRIIERLRSSGLNAVSARSLKAMWLSFRAGKIFSTSADEFFLGFTNGCEYFELWHGMPLKKIGYDDNVSKGNNTFIRRVSMTLNKKFFLWKSFFTMKNVYTLTNSDFFMPFLQSAFNMPKERILTTGLPRTDALFFHNEEKLIKKIKSDFPRSKIILYMPTFRTGVWSKQPFNPFEEKYGFNSDEFSEFLEEQNLVFLYKPHFIDLELGQKENLGRRFIFINDESYDELYNFAGQADFLATDYSSIYFDFIATEKPVVLLPFDLEEYLETSREHYFDYSMVEGSKAASWKEFYRIFRDKLYSPASSQALKKFAEYVDGNCCGKLIETIKNLNSRKIDL